MKKLSLGNIQSIDTAFLSCYYKNTENCVRQSILKRESEKQATAIKFQIYLYNTTTFWSTIIWSNFQPNSSLSLSAFDTSNSWWIQNYVTISNFGNISFPYILAFLFGSPSSEWQERQSRAPESCHRGSTFRIMWLRCGSRRLRCSVRQ